MFQWTEGLGNNERTEIQYAELWVLQGGVNSKKRKGEEQELSRDKEGHQLVAVSRLATQPSTQPAKFSSFFKSALHSKERIKRIF